MINIEPKSEMYQLKHRNVGRKLGTRDITRRKHAKFTKQYTRRKKFVKMGATSSKPPSRIPASARKKVTTMALRGSSPFLVPCLKNPKHGKISSRAIACKILAEPNIEPKAVERHAVATPSTMK